MALSDLKIFQWYQKYIVKAADLTNVVTWLRGMSEGTFEGLTGAAILKGLKVTPSSGLTVNVEAGIAVDPNGRIIVIDAATATFASPVGNPAKSLLVARPKLTDTTLIPEPINPTNSVYLYKKFEYDLVIINGTPASTPSYPATQANDVILMGVKLTAGHSTIAVSDLDFGKVDRPRKKSHKVLEITSSLTMTGDEEIIEANFSGASGVITPPAALDVVGKSFTIMKTDSSSNNVAVSGASISGQNPVILDTQWQSITIYSNGSSYRSF